MYGTERCDGNSPGLPETRRVGLASGLPARMTALAVAALCLLPAMACLLHAGDAPAVVTVSSAVPGGYVPARGSLDLDINYPGAGLRYFVSDGKAFELVGQSGDRVFTGALRYYYYPAALARGPLCPYVAAEGAYITFKGDYSKGNGWGGGIYGGTEYWFSRSFSMQADIGADYIHIKDKHTSLGQGGLEFILNMGFNIYFGGARS